MSDELTPQEEPLAEDQLDDAEFEEISSEEVDTVVATLEQLIESTESENICAILEDASNTILYLVYDESDLEDSDEDEAPEAQAA